MATPMNSMTLAEIRDRYRRGENITALFRRLEGSGGNSLRAIEVAYDMQAGSYVAALDDPEFAEFHAGYSAEIAHVIDGLGGCSSLLEVGVGEATTLSQVAKSLSTPASGIAGFDISWSRIDVARDFARGRGLAPTLFVADLFAIPFADSSIDIVYTSHSIEPNGGREREALSELFRVASRYVVLLEPSNELGSEETRARTLEHGYVQDLGRHASELGFKAVEHRLVEPCANPRNQTALLVLEKDPRAAPRDTVELVSPVSKGALVARSDHMYAESDLLAFPLIGGIPCLRPEQGVVATRFADRSTRA